MKADISRRLRTARSKKGWSAKQTAKALCVPESICREWEYGRPMKTPPFERIASVLEISLTELITGNAAGLEWVGDELSEIEQRISDLRCRLKART